MSADRRMPADVAAEQCVLGGLMQGAGIEDLGDLSAGDFYRPAHKVIFDALSTLIGAGKPADPVAAMDELRRSGRLAALGDDPGNYLHECYAARLGPGQVGYYAGIVRELAERRRLIESADRVRQAAARLEEPIEVVREMAAQQAQLASAGPLSTGDRRIVLTPAALIPPRPVFWGWQDRMPSSHLSLIPGREGIGKSLLLIWLTSQLTRGTLPGVHLGTPRPVFYCATEDSWQHTIAPRLIAHGADLELVYRVEVEAIQTSMRMELTMPRDCALLAAEVKRLEVAMVALDPMMSVIDRAVDTYNDREMRTVLEPLGRLADETGCMIVGLAHFNKTATDDPLTLVTGSRAFTAVVRAVVAVARDPEAEDGGCVVSQVKNNLGRLDLPNLTYVVRTATVETAEGDAEVGRLHFTGESERSVRDILADAGNGADRTERAECADWLRQALAGGPRLSKEVTREGEDRGFSPRTQSRARKQLRVDALKESDGTWWMSLPTDPLARTP